MMFQNGDHYRSITRKMINKISLLHKCDVLVVGGGPAGSIAAVAAAREGADTVLVEQNGF